MTIDRPLPAGIEALVEPLAGHIALAVLRVAQGLAHETVSVLAADCHPWHAILELSLLTRREVEQDPALRSDGEQASWRFFQFTRNETHARWPEVAPIAERLRQHHRSSSDRSAAATDAFMCCARALVHPVARRAIEALPRHADFTVWVVNPDDPDAHNHCDFMAGRVRSPWPVRE